MLTACEPTTEPNPSKFHFKQREHPDQIVLAHHPLFLIVINRLDKSHSNTCIPVHVQVNRVDGVPARYRGRGKGNGSGRRSAGNDGFGRDFGATLECCFEREGLGTGIMK